MVFTCTTVIYTVTGEEVYSLAVAVFNARNHGGGKFISYCSYP